MVIVVAVALGQKNNKGLVDRNATTEWISILYGFPCEDGFSHQESPNPTRV